MSASESPVLKKLLTSFPAFLQAIALRVSPVLVLVLCLFLTGVGFFMTFQSTRQEEHARFERLTRNLTMAIESRLQIYENALVATHGLFVASEPVSRKEFHEFVSQFNLQDRYPGIQGIGYTLRLMPEDLDTHVRSVRQSGLANYHVWPEQKRDEYFSILYIEPFDWRNQRALGYDMFSEPLRREAMERARDTGQPAASGKVTLVQETKQNAQPGFLIYLPLYRKGLPTRTVDERRRALQGFIYSPFRATDLFKYVSVETLQTRPRVRVRIYDGTDAIEQNLLFDSATQSGKQATSQEASQPQKTKSDEPPIHQEDLILTIAGRPWFVTVTSTPEFELRPARNWSWSLLVLGCLISFLFYFLFRFARRMNDQLRRDLASKEKAQAEILKARQAAEEANQAKSRFLANMSHEIRTPLGVIIGFADLALESVGPDLQAQHYLKTIKRNGQQLVTLIGEVLDLSKIEANKLEVEYVRFSLPQTLDEVMSSLQVRAKEKDVRLTWDQSHQIPDQICSDPVKFRQILMNLAGNAIKFTSNGEVRVTPRLLSEAELGAPIKLEIEVEDTGIGMSAEDRKKLFQPFQQADPSMTRRYGGTGLGLMLSRQLARTLGGDVELRRSELGRGSLFVFCVDGGPFEGLWAGPEPAQVGAPVGASEPAASVRAGDGGPEQAQGQGVQNEPVPPQLPLTGVRVLLVEDSKENQYLLSRYLKGAGADVETANDGQEGVEKATHGHHDVVLMDIQMPVLDGHQATQRLRQQGFRTPIVALTAHAFREERERALSGGFNGYLTKPLSRAALIDGVRQLVPMEL